MQQVIRNKILGSKWWTTKAFEQRQELCDYEYETVKSISSRLRKSKYDRDLEVNNYSETSSQGAARQREAEIQRKYDEFKGITTPAAVVDNDTEVNATIELDSDEERAEEEKARKRSKKLKKADVPVAVTSTKRRASLASQNSIGSAGSFQDSPRNGGLKRQRSMGSRQNSFKSQKSNSSLH
jgi:hypothetical protein